MLMKRRVPFGVLLTAGLLAAVALPLAAQIPGGNPLVTVVADCSLPPTPYIAGRPGLLTIDVRGRLCGLVTGNTTVPTYSAAVTALTNTAAGDLYCIGGSATKTVYVKGIRISATANTATVGDASIVLRSTADSGGGAAAVSVVRLDQDNAAPTASVTSFTSAPTAGTSIGAIRSRKFAVNTSGNAALASEGLFQFSVYWDQPVTLRGTGQFACVNASALGAGASWDIDHEHTEE